MVNLHEPLYNAPSPVDAPCGTLVVSGSPLDRLIAAWLHAKWGRTQSDRTRETYAGYLASFRAALQATSLDLDADPQAVALAAQGWSSQSTRGRTLAPASVKLRLAALSSFYAYAVKMGYMTTNPIIRLDRPHIEAYAGARALDEHTVTRYMQEIDRTTLAGKRDYALLVLALTTGRRLGALVSLRRHDVEQSGDQVMITFRREKGGKQTRKMLVPEVGHALLAWLHTYYGKPLHDLPPDAPIWVSLDNHTRGATLGRQSLGDICQRRIGTSKVHALRHSFAQAMLNAGASVSAISAELGHTDLKVTSVYLKQLTSAYNPHADAVAGRFGLKGER